jgi:hypothetical protein
MALPLATAKLCGFRKWEDGSEDTGADRADVEPRRAAGHRAAACCCAARLSQRDAADQCESWEDVLPRLATEPFDVLIAEFGPASPTIDSLFRLQPKLFVIEVDLAQGTSDVHVIDVGSETLVRLAEWLAREAGLTRANDTVARITHPGPTAP